MTSDSRLGIERSLDVALSAAAEMNRVIAAADAKVGLTLAGQGVVLIGAAATVRDRSGLPGPAGLSAVAALVLACSSVVLLATALWPRPTRPTGDGPVFPSLRPGDGVQAAVAPGELAARAWTRVDVLAGIARCKHKWFRAALTCGTGALLAFTCAAVLAAHV